MKLENLLKLLAVSKSDELRIEPNSQPYFTIENGKKNATEVVLTAADISALIFPAIPVEEKMRLPNVPQVSFDIRNEAGEFAVVVVKSPNGLSVKVNQHSAGVLASNANHPQTALPDNATVAPAVKDFKLTAPPVESAKPKSLFNSLQSAFGSNPKSREAAESVAGAQPEQTAPTVPAAASLTTVSAGAPVNFPTQTPPASANQFAPKIVLPELEDAPELADNFTAETAPSYHKPKVNSNSNGNADSPHKQKMDALFYKMAEIKASDLHMSVSSAPMVRKDGRMAILDESHSVMTAEAMRELLWSIMPEKNREEFERRHDTDFAYEIPDLARFRANIFMDRKGMGAVFRIIPTKILTAEQLGLSKAILDLCNLSKGLVVVTGPTGSGKSTTLCAMVDYINKSREDHIITIEDPIEFTHESQKCLVNQREVHNHTDSFKDALRAALREDPDILLVGEMRDLETISIAIETAETGHLVFGTLHTTTAPSTVDRIIDQFPADRQQQIRVMLSESLKGVIAQTLLPKKGGGRVAALEILIVTPAISNLIREGKTFQIASSMQTGKQHGMVILNDALIDLVKQGLVEPRDAYIKAVDKTGFESLLTRSNIKM